MGYLAAAKRQATDVSSASSESATLGISASESRSSLASLPATASGSLSQESASATSNSITSQAETVASVTVTTTGLDAGTTEAPKNAAVTVISVISPPPFTATSTTPYEAPGVNATSSAVVTSSSSTHLSASTTATSTSSFVDPAEQARASATGFGIPSNQLTACRINETWPDASPFCSPDNNQGLWTGYTYALTWNSDLFDANATNIAQLRYTDKSLGLVWSSAPVPNIQGYVDVEVSKEWLKGADGKSTFSGQNASLVLVSTTQGSNELVTKTGPQVSLILDPQSLPKVLIPKIASKYGLQIGLPIGLVAVILILFSIIYGIRRNNAQHRSIRGISKDYMARRHRERGGKPDISLSEYNSPDLDDRYTDQPLQGGPNHFREEIARQRVEDDASFRRFPSSF